MPLSWQDLYRVIQGKTPLQTLIDPGEDEPDFFVPGFNQRGGRTTAQWMRALGGRPFPTVQPPKPPKPKTLEELLGNATNIQSPVVDPLDIVSAGLSNLNPRSSLDTGLDDLIDIVSRVEFDPSWKGALTGAEAGGLTGGLGGGLIGGAPGAAVGAGGGTLVGAVVGGLGPGLKEKIELPDRPDPDPYLTSLTNPVGPYQPVSVSENASNITLDPTQLQEVDPYLSSLIRTDPALSPETPPSMKADVETDYSDLSAAGTGLSGAINVGRALTDDESSTAARTLQGLEGGAQLYNAGAQALGGDQIPGIGPLFTAANAVQTGLEADSAEAGAAGAQGVIMDSLANTMFPGLSMWMGGHSFGEIMSRLFPPDIPHDVREDREVSNIILPAERLSQYIEMSSNPLELAESVSLASQIPGYLIDADGNIHLSAGVSPGRLDSAQARLTKAINDSRLIFEAARQGQPEALAMLNDRSAKRADFMDAVQSAGLLPTDANTGNFSGSSGGSLSSLGGQPLGREGSLLNIIMFGGASPNSIYGGDLYPTGGVDPETGAPITVPRAQIPLNLSDIASRIPRLTPDQKEFWRSALFTQDPEMGTYNFIPQGYGLTVRERPPETEEEIARAWEANLARMRAQMGP